MVEMVEMLSEEESQVMVEQGEMEDCHMEVEEQVKEEKEVKEEVCSEDVEDAK